MHSSLIKHRPSFLKKTFRSHRFLLFLFLFTALALFSFLNPYIESRILKLHTFEEEFIKSDFFSSHRNQFRHLNACAKNKRNKKFGIRSFVRSNVSAFQDITQRRLSNISNVSELNELKSNQSLFLHLLVHGDCNHDALHTTLSSILSVDYDDEIVHLSIVSNCSETFDQIKHFRWNQGSFRLIQSQTKSTIDSIQHIFSKKSNEFFFLLSTSSTLSPDFYKNFKKIVFVFFENVISNKEKINAKDKTFKTVENEKNAKTENSLLSFSSEPTETIFQVFENKFSSNKNNFLAGEENFFGISLDAFFAFSNSENLNLEKTNEKNAEKYEKNAEKYENNSENLGNGMDGVPSRSFLSQSLSDTCQILLPHAWETFWKWHAVSQFDVNKKKVHFEPMAMDFSLPCRSDWKNSFYTFASEKNYFNFHPNYPNSHVSICNSGRLDSPNYKSVQKDNPKNKNLNIKVDASHNVSAENYVNNAMEFLPTLTRFDRCGRILKKGFLAKNVQELQTLLKRIHYNNSVIGVMISPSFKQMMLNWICYVKDQGLRNYFFITQSKAQARDLIERGMDVFVPRMNVGMEVKNSTSNSNSDAGADGGDDDVEEGESENAMNYGSIAYKQFISTRTHFIGRILHLGYKVLLADVDSVWLSDPFPHMQDPQFDIFAQLEYSGNPCGGFLYLLPTNHTMSLWDEIDSQFERHIAGLRTHPSRSNTTQFQRFIQSQQHVHEQTFLRNALKKKAFGVKMKGLDSLMFINGRDYFTRKKAIKANVTPVMIHNNYIIGKENKIRRFMHNGMWRVDSLGSCKCLDMKCNH